jgi:hypothetical protein
LPPPFDIGATVIPNDPGPTSNSSESVQPLLAPPSQENSMSTVLTIIGALLVRKQYREDIEYMRGPK